MRPLPARADRRMVFFRLGPATALPEAQRIDLRWYFAKWNAVVRARCDARIERGVKREALALVERIEASVRTGGFPRCGRWGCEACAGKDTGGL